MNSYYQEPNVNDWVGRPDAFEREYIFQCIQTQAFHQLKKAQANQYALIGFACDAGVKRNHGRIGAQAGPAAFRHAFARLTIPKPISIIDVGNILCFDDQLEIAQTQLADHVFQLLQLGYQPIAIGGGHETAWGHFQGLTKLYDDIAIVNFDAHFDLREIKNQQGNSGTPFRQIYDYCQQHKKPFHYYCAGIQPTANAKNLFAFAEKSKTDFLLAQMIHQHPEQFLIWIKKIIQQHQHIYLTICLDVFAAFIAPGVSAPHPLGLLPQPIIEALQLLKKSQKVISLDIVELAPCFDMDHITAKLAANLLTYFLTTE